jgi:hypothetical protein
MYYNMSNNKSKSGLLGIVATCIITASSLTSCFTDYTTTVKQDDKKTTTITLPRGKGTYLGLFGKGMVYYGMDRDSTFHISLPIDNARVESIDATRPYFHFNNLKYDIISVTDDTLKVSYTRKIWHNTKHR